MTGRSNWHERVASWFEAEPVCSRETCREDAVRELERVHVRAQVRLLVACCRAALAESADTVLLPCSMRGDALSWASVRADVEEELASARADEFRCAPKLALVL